MRHSGDNGSLRLDDCVSRCRILPIRRPTVQLNFRQLDCKLSYAKQYNRDEVKLDFLHADRVDFSEYATSSIWDMMDAPAVLTEDRSRIEFQVRIRCA
ncbi:hypothetical protein ANCDUO_09494 [Ancylostoma duodenale]|uniref:Neurotransmitter-gated ion-channel ligand-binding domain-containing protein n=1 Tax=Ancylostoma duodenale TaxID=51022 RepID=A0A0C2GML7_9BILA|nr:hypothetical protein ANCDUO_09494 [Ancylostoma duodenale]